MSTRVVVFVFSYPVLSAQRSGSPAPRGATIHRSAGTRGTRERGPVRRVQPGVIRLVERGLLTDEAQDAGSDVRFTPGRRATPAPPASFASANTRAMVAPGGSVLGTERAELRACDVENTTGAPSSNQNHRRRASVPLRVSWLRARDPRARASTDPSKVKTNYAPSV